MPLKLEQALIDENIIENYLETTNVKIVHFQEYFEITCKFNNLIIKDYIMFTIQDNNLLFKYNDKHYISTISNMEYIFYKCIFESSVSLNVKNSSKNINFNGCLFKEEFCIECNDNKTTESSKQIFIKDSTIKFLTFFKTTIDVDFKINSSAIDTIDIVDVVFEEIFELHDVIINKDAYITEVIFRKISVFDSCTFNTCIFFQHVFFDGFSYFRDSSFNDGLNIEYCSNEKEMNFFNSNISKQNTTQETFRIIKHQFEKLGNKIEANKYHALELDQKRKKLEEEKGDWKERLVFMFHDLSSEHSTNWFLALMWIFIIGFSTAILNQSFWYLLLAPIIILISFVYGENKYIKLWIFILCFSVIITISSKIDFNSVFMFLNIILKAESFGGNYFLMALNKISLGYLYYQFLLSVRKDTRK